MNVTVAPANEKGKIGIVVIDLIPIFFLLWAVPEASGVFRKK